MKYFLFPSQIQNFMRKKTLIVFSIIIIIFISPFLLENSFAQNQIIPPRPQWKETPDPDLLTCKDGLLLLQKTNGSPACVSPTTYLKLLDRGYGKFDSSQLMKRPIMMDNLMSGMVGDSQLMHHWHTMITNDSKIMNQTMSKMVLQLKENPDLMPNIMGAMTSNPDLRVQMIEIMKNHELMMKTFHEHSGWMDSVHQPMTGSKMSQNMGHGIIGNHQCSWCPELPLHDSKEHPGFHQPKIMEDLIHHIWVDADFRNKMHSFMLENPLHMAHMTDQLLEPTLGHMMNDAELRQQMIELMLEHHEFMNSIRHENILTN